MLIYFAGCFEAMSASRKNILHLPIENRLLSFYFIEKIPHEMYLQRGEKYYPPEGDKKPGKVRVLPDLPTKTKMKKDTVIKDESYEWPMLNIF